MRKFGIVTAFVFLAAPADATETYVCFTPGQDCTTLIVQELDQARQMVLVQAYSFTSAPIAKALLEALIKVPVSADA